MARRISSSCTQVEPILDPENDRVQLGTIQKAPAIVGKRMIAMFEDLLRAQLSPAMASWIAQEFSVSAEEVNSKTPCLRLRLRFLQPGKRALLWRVWCAAAAYLVHD